MLKFSCFVVLAVFTANIAAVAQGNAQATKSSEDASKADPKQGDLPVVTKMLAYGKKEPGKVWREEVTDERLFRLFDLADTKKEGVVTREQLVVAAKKQEAEQPQGGRRGPEGGPGGGGPGGRGGFGGRPQLGVFLPRFVQDELKLSDAQKQQVADLQKELDTKLDNILNDDQKKQYKEMKDNPGRGGPGGGPGGRGRGGPGGPQ